MVCDPSGMFSDPSDHLSTKEDVLQSKIGYHHSQCAGIRVASGTLQQGGGGEIRPGGDVTGFAGFAFLAATSLETGNEYQAYE
jgi:hypothetical protein